MEVTRPSPFLAKQTSLMLAVIQWVSQIPFNGQYTVSSELRTDHYSF